MERVQRQTELIVLSYFPSLHQKLNVAVILVQSEGNHPCEIDCRFLQNMQLLSALDPNADIEVLSATFREIKERLRSEEHREQMLRIMEDSFSNCIRISDRQSVTIKDNISTELDEIVARYLQR